MVDLIAMQTAPQVIILTIGAAEKGPEIVELDPPQSGRGATFADRADPIESTE